MWPPLKDYNGYSHAERVRGWQAIKVAIRLGIMMPPSAFPCSICSAPLYCEYHMEDYRVLEAFPVCKSCHCKLHQRFTKPAPWLALVEKHGKGQEWFERLEMKPIPHLKICHMAGEKH